MIFQLLSLALLGIIFIHPLITYYRDPKNLLSFPGPPIAGYTSLWRIYHNLRNRHFLAIHAAHKTYGSHVRIAPNHISILDTSAMNDIYGHGAGFLKDAWYDGGAGEYRNMSDARVKEEHQAKRKMLAHVFAQKYIATFEPVIKSTLQRLMRRVDDHVVSGEGMNMRRYLNFFTIDTFAKLMFDEEWGCLDRGDDVVFAETPEGKVYRTPYIVTVHDPTVISTILGFEAGWLWFTKKIFSFHPWAKTGKHFENIIAHATRKRLERDDTETNDIMSKLLVNNKGEATGLSKGDILAEASVMMNAGTDTTTAALTYTIFLLYKHREILSRLRAEIDTATAGQDFISYDSASQLPFLRACIEESLRLRPPSSFGLPRTVPKGGRIIAGQFISENVTVSVPTYSMLRNETAFDAPNTYNPERWISGDKEKMAKAHFPFSTGPRACIGRNIAYYEQLMVVANLVREFDFELEREDFELRTIERFNSNPDELVLKCSRRTR